MSHSVPVHLVQITDTHLFDQPTKTLMGLPTAKSLAAIVEQVSQLDPRPDLILLTGDLSQDGSLLSYSQLQQQLSRLELPLYALPGNHDQPEIMKSVFSPPLSATVDAFASGAWQFLLLDSQVEAQVGGHLAPESLDWLDQQLQRTAPRPTLIALHHPPFQVNSDWLDKSGLDNPEALFAVLDRHPQVKLVLFGHIHQEFCHQRRGVSYLGSPSTSVQFLPLSQEFALDPCPPGFRCLTLYPEGEYRTQVVRVNFSHELDLVTPGY
jgi:3',5'-cyclic-AMP phosphodiesterase